jgi:hypothetical protein
VEWSLKCWVKSTAYSVVKFAPSGNVLFECNEKMIEAAFVAVGLHKASKVNERKTSTPYMKAYIKAQINAHRQSSIKAVKTMYNSK